jgi:hypothetical protein
MEREIKNVMRMLRDRDNDVHRRIYDFLSSTLRYAEAQSQFMRETEPTHSNDPYGVPTQRRN